MQETWWHFETRSGDVAGCSLLHMPTCGVTSLVIAHPCNPKAEGVPGFRYGFRDAPLLDPDMESQQALLLGINHPYVLQQSVFVLCVLMLVCSNPEFRSIRMGLPGLPHSPGSAVAGTIDFVAETEQLSLQHAETLQGKTPKLV